MNFVRKEYSEIKREEINTEINWSKKIFNSKTLQTNRI